MKKRNSTIRRATITLNVKAALAMGEDRHPQVIMRLLAHAHGFAITDWNDRWNEIPQKVDFEVDVEGKEMPTLPSYCRTRPHR